MPNKDKLALRYAARLTAIYDYITVQVMDRDYNSLNRSDCMEALKKMGRVPETLELHNLWSQVSNECSGIRNEDVEAIEVWRIQDAYKYYHMQRREIEAVEALKRVYEKDGRDLFAISKDCDVYCWTLKGWLTKQKRISWKMVKSLENLEKEGKDYTIMDAFRGMQEVYRNADTSRVEKKKEFNGEGA